MNLNGKNLDEYLLSLDKPHAKFKEFPRQENFPLKYKTIASELDKWVHSDVGIGAAYADKHAGVGMLTNHGPSHIKTLIATATQFVENIHSTLSPFEIYLLLVAIQIHDVGNILGRENHHIHAREIVELLSSGVVKQDKLILQAVLDIAEAHNGEVIELLSFEEHLFNLPYRPQLLAAILKFADELSENYERASNINLVLDNVPEESLLYHYYAHSINSILPNPQTREINIIFNIDENILTKEFQKGNEKVFLIDEIYLRTLKTYGERCYCAKFLRPYINFDSIKVTIKIMLPNRTTIKMGYELSERGIRTVNMEEAFRICPQLKNWTGQLVKDAVEAGQTKEIFSK